MHAPVAAPWRDDDPVGALGDGQGARQSMRVIGRGAKWTSPENHDLARCIDGGDDHHVEPAKAKVHWGRGATTPARRRLLRQRNETMARRGSGARKTELGDGHGRLSSVCLLCH